MHDGKYISNMLGAVRKPDTLPSVKHRICTGVACVVFGCALGVLQKWIDATAFNEQPLVFQALDIGNYFGRLSVWILLATAISVYAQTPLEASAHTFLFLLSMVASYYLYCHLVLGFLPRSYLMMWVALSCLSAPLAWVCWYAKGEGLVAIAISSVILGVLFSQAFLITQGFYMTHALDAVTWVIGVVLLYREPRELGLSIALSLVVAIAYQLFIPYWG